MSIPLRILSSSDYGLARTCSAKLYFRKNGFRETTEGDPYLRLLRDGSFMVKALVRARYPSAVDIATDISTLEAARETIELLARPSVTIANATVVYGRRVARIDIIEKQGETVRIVDVRSKSIDGTEHLASLAAGGRGALCSKKKPWTVLADWKPRLEELAFKAICVAGLQPNAMIKSFLSLVDKSKRSAIDDVPSLFEIMRDDGHGRSRFYTRFVGDESQLSALDLVTEIDCTDEVSALLQGVETAASAFESHLDADLDALFSLGATRDAGCSSCEFRTDEGDIESGFRHCWGELGAVSPHVLELFSVGTVRMADGTPLVEALFQQGKASLFDVPRDRLVTKDGIPGANNVRQLRQIEQTESGKPYIGPGLAGAIANLAYPLYFIDFEASRLALPYHSGMKPYGLVAFQWSCHVIDYPGAAPRHVDWLNDRDYWPNEEFAESLRAVAGDSGSILTWSYFERATLKDIAGELRARGRERPELLSWLDDVHTRVVDLEKWAKTHYYHPGMRGRTSIKVVLDALWRHDPAMRAAFEAATGRHADAVVDPYHSLPSFDIGGAEYNVREGTAAIRAYQAMMYGADRDELTRSKWRTALREYCGLDTLAMLLIFEHWKGLVS